MLVLATITVLLVGKACSQEAYGPYNVIGYNYTDRNIFLPDLPNKHDGYIEFHFLPERKIEAK
ncbi:hypothetical protein FNF07_21425 [Trinickia caryophylli]|nr:hypothetical protein [Trinickia caryophylli]PMS12029.1 hypothetical protein C0Z17_12490 [Trinickia caryophylli]TRX15336.1 hypothetical protein FNF07_21425 [Trinickia caryophylli]